MKGFWSEFRNFAVKGNALELAFAVVIGTAFTAVVNSLVTNIITPLVSLVTPGSGDIKNLGVTLYPATVNNGTTTPAIILGYGTFISAIINFFIIALSIFVVFKLITSARKKLFRQGEDAVPPHEKPDDVRLLEEIRDLLKEKK